MQSKLSNIKKVFTSKSYLMIIINFWFVDIEKFEKINEIEKEFNCNVFVFSTKTGENVNEMLYFLTKKIIENSKQTKRSKKKKKHIQTKKIPLKMA